MKTLLVSSTAGLLLLGSQLAAGAPCASSQRAAPMTVEDTAGVLQLAATINCSGGSFGVEWVGSIIVEETIRLFGGTTLSIMGAVDGTSVVDGTDRTALFEVDSGTLHFNLLTLVNGTGDRGGAIYATGATINASSCTVSNNSGVDGGGVFLNRTVLVTTNSSFAHNTASGHGGALYGEASNVTFGENVQLEHNEALFGGALYVASNSILVLTGDNVLAAGNTASMDGGGLYAHQSTANVTGNAELVRNTAQIGGAIYTDNASIAVIGDMIMSRNFASDEGGAFYSWMSVFDIEGTVIWKNNSALARAGGLSMWKTIWHVKALGKASFVGNAADFGGATYVSTSTVVVDGDVGFAENYVSVRGGALCSDVSTIYISGYALWENNWSQTGGGALRMWQSDMIVQPSGKVEFVGNTGEFGGAAHVDNGMLLAHGDMFYSNNLASANGGALYAIYSVGDVGAYGLWENNTALQGGGALSTLASNFSVQSLGRASFVNNSAFSVGGAVYVSHSECLIEGDVCFSNNSVHERGGALHSDLSVITIAGTVWWTKNSAQDSAGALAMWSSELRVQFLGRVEFRHNAAVSGGAISSDDSTVSLDGNLSMTNNAAEYIGGALVCSRSDVDVSGAAVWKNKTSLGRGGAIVSFHSNINVQVSGYTEFVSNNAAFKGGAAYMDNSSLLFNGYAGFTENVAESGGALYSDLSVIIQNKATVWKHNSAQMGGGCVYLWNSTLHVTSFGTAVYFGNEAGWGGAIYPLGSILLIDDNVSFTNNSVTDVGGAVFGHKPAVNITGRASWDSNMAVNAGGGMALVETTLHMMTGRSSSFSKNIANIGGGMPIGENAAAVVAGRATFADNHAETGGGIKTTQFSSVDLSGALVAMLGNTALSSGGGMHCESPTLLRLDGVQFTSNRAGVSGGAITTLSAGITRVRATDETDPAIISNCSFSNNAADAGGGFFIGGGFVEITGSLFRNNTAGDALNCFVYDKKLLYNVHFR